MRASVGRIQFYRFTQIVYCPTIVFFEDIRLPSSVIGMGIRRRKPDCLSVVQNGRVTIMFESMGVAPPIIGGCVIRLNTEGPIEVCLGWTPQLGQRRGQVKRDSRWKV